ncbi:MAG: hypothetical protein Q8941_23390 [Bacteroidota bacterium]|nr:hypothetical protein [Bacteroidota bacterium]
MSIKKINPRFAVLALLMIAAAAMRIPDAAALTPWSNFTPIGAMGLFGGAYFSKNWKAFAFPLLALLASDIIIDVFIYNNKYGILYGSWYWVYAGFCVIVLLGKWLLQKITISNLLVAAISSTLIYWLIVDFGVFLFGCTDITSGKLMDHSFSSLLKCYAQGAPYIKNFLLGTIVYSGLMFGIFEWLKAKKPQLQASLE